MFVHLQNSSQHTETRMQFDIDELTRKAIVYQTWHKDRSRTTLHKAYSKELLRQFRPSFTPPP